MQAARHETISFEEMALKPIDQYQRTAPSDIGLLAYPGMGFENGANWNPYMVRMYFGLDQSDGIQPTPVFSEHFENPFPNSDITGPDTQFGFWNSAATLYPNTDLSNVSVSGSFTADFPAEGSAENGCFTAMKMNAIELDFFNELPSVDHTNVISPNQAAPMLGPAIYPPPFINPDNASYLPAQVPVQQPVLPSRQQVPQRTSCTRCPSTFSRRTDLPRHMASVHGVGRRAHRCPRPGCRKTYSRSDKVLEHRRKAGH